MLDIERLKLKLFGIIGKITGNYYRQNRLILQIQDRRHGWGIWKKKEDTQD